MKRIITALTFFSFMAIALTTTILNLPAIEVEDVIAEMETTTAIPWFNSLSHNEQMNHLALGDSLAKGYGSEKNGYVGIATDDLNNIYHLKFQLENLAKNGTTSENLLKLLQDNAIKEEISQAHLITISVGGNDILKLRKQMGLVEGIKIFGSIREQYVENLTEILTVVREENPNAVIVLSQLYNPLDLDGFLVPIVNSFIKDWNNDIARIAPQFAPVATIKTTELLKASNRDTWAYDEVHPNDVGYRILADEMLRELAEVRVEKDVHLAVS